MSDVITQHNLFRPTRSKAETKADITDNTARAIIDAEAASREAKTARLRKARLEQEERAAAVPAPAKQRRTKTAAPRRARSST
ncbi:hypothetical protein [Chelativorans sp. AA-79]|uniref:hypothetical protein n=1 Tax=Chelativorans sp. AA-79 TaxID=3028735 RepID=UPI0023F6EF37|nr:hypothetical protein [Chelativorans sp. AA-79]WEX07855.1 hypothetical protein PVE73_17375 [Chelativorans sp. AA-79]